MRFPAVAALAVLGLGLAWPALHPQEDAGLSPFFAFHYDSQPQQGRPVRHLEVWCVERVPEGWTAANLTATLDGVAVPLQWNGPVARHAKFSFLAAERDQEHSLDLFHDGEHAWGVPFGAGAGTPVGCG